MPIVHEPVVDQEFRVNESQEKVVLGWRERVELPAWDVSVRRAKLDSGARTSALHVTRVERLGNDRVGFEVVLRERPQRVTRWIEADLVRESVVKPSSGGRQTRPVVRTTIRIGPVEREAEISLVCREGMLCRMLIGRKSIGNAAVIDPSRTYLVTKRPGRRKKKERAT